MVPTGKEGKKGYTLVSLNLAGKMVDQKALPLDAEKSREKEDRDKAIMAAVGTGKEIRYADHTIIVTDNGQRIAYLLGGKFPGFKTFIGVMLALDPKYTMVGLEILEHEEDPGLGAEIEQDYFKNQFKGRTFDILKGLKVVKEPLPAEYQQALEGSVAEADMAHIIDQYKEKDIYALTGATISSDAHRWRQGDGEEICLSPRHS